MLGAPLIGFTLDYEEAGGWSKMPWYAIRENYMTAISELGGIPIALPHEIGLAAEYAGRIDALVVTGGSFDVHPSMYGAGDVHATVSLKERRTQFEAAVTRAMLASKKPILGICGGEQLLNVILGGTLIQHIPDAVPNALAHEQPNPRTEAGHTVRIAKGSLLGRIVNELEVPVNSAHHQAVDKTGPGVSVNAVASDGVIEGIEYADHPFCLGVQWHPEYKISHADTKIFEAFLRACVV